MVENLIAASGSGSTRSTGCRRRRRRRPRPSSPRSRSASGYPDTWRDYSGLEVNARRRVRQRGARASCSSTAAQLAKLGKPVDRGEWVMTPQMVNAVNLPAMNALNFPAAILQPPFFDPSAPPAMDYGAIGAIIGHEISHSFDNQGALFDAEGRLRNWWTPEDFAHFEASVAAARRAVRRLQAVPRPRSQRPADPRREHRRRRRASPRPTTPTAVARRQAGAGGAGLHRRPAVLHRLRAELAGQAPRADPAEAPSSPTATRRTSIARQTVRNIDAWYKAFGVKKGQTLYLAPDDRVRVW